jgi:hypothetical protein
MKDSSQMLMSRIWSNKIEDMMRSNSIKKIQRRWKERAGPSLGVALTVARSAAVFKRSLIKKV